MNPPNANATAHAAVAARPAPTFESASQRRLQARASVVRLLTISDMLAGAVAGLVSGALVGGLHDVRLVVFAVVVTAAWPLSAFAGGLYAHDDPPSWRAGIGEAKRLTVIAVLVSWPLWGIALAVGAHAPDGTAILAAAAVGVLTLATRGVARELAHQKDALRQRTLILGSGVVAGQLAEKLATQPELGLDLIGVVDDDPHSVAHAALAHLGTRDELNAILRRHEVDRVVVAFSRATHQELLACMRVCWDNGVTIDVVPRLFELLDGARRVDRVGGMPTMSIDTPNLTRGTRAAKRALDLVGSMLLLLLLTPLLLAVALAIKLDSRGPVFFRQPRAGRAGRVFALIKFRSMYDGADERKDELAAANEVDDGVMFKIRQDPRVTRVGQFLRRFSLDELPQLFNVVRGDMSLVGPRPLILAESQAMAEAWHARRLDLRPGMTGPWQIYGRSEVSYQEMLSLDYQYVAGWSLSRDVEILLSTVPAVCFGRGAY